MQLDNNQQAFFELLKAGLWEKDARFSQYKNIDYPTISQLAEEQSVVGVVAAGFEHVSDVKVPQQWALQFAGQTIQLEQRNTAMNHFVAGLIEQLREVDVYTLLLKGQGIAQCYERPLWRACGDVDLFLSSENYVAAKNILTPSALSIDEEQEERKHLALTINGWTVELHGTLRTNLWKSLEKMIDSVQDDIFFGGSVRSWMNGRTQVFLMGADEDAVFVFVHILQHFFIEGIGLRQICDWCRLLDTYKDKINKTLLVRRLKSGRLMSKWKVFASFAVEYLGMPSDAMPLYDPSYCWKRKAKGVLELVMDSGNFGQGKDKSYKQKYSKVVRYMISFCRHFKDGYRRFKLFPAEALLMWWKLMMHGLRGVLGIGANGSGL